MIFKLVPNVLFAASIALVTSCASPRLLAPAPTLYSADAPYPADRVAESLRKPEANLIFVTDRLFDPEIAKFGAMRSAAMSAGTVNIEIGDGISWDDLIRLSHLDTVSSKQPELRVSSMSNTINFPETPIPFAFKNGAFSEREDLRAEYDIAVKAFQNLVRDRMSEANTRDVLIYIHGFNNSFDDAAYALADLWHFSGRSAVPIMFSWPASDGNMLGYFADRESGEFSIFHVKEILRALQDTEGLEAIHFIAHSRGTDVTTTALRELVIEARASGRSGREVLKIQNLILAAPDLDLAVVKQRLIAERFGPAIGQITIYSNPKDTALGLSSFISAGLRFGRVTSEDLGERIEEVFRGVRNVHFVNASHVPGVVGHSYFRTHPGIVADISVILQTDAAPGTPERPLIPVSGNFYELTDDYRPTLQ